MDKKASLYKLAAEMAADVSLPLKSNLVFGEGSSDAIVMFIGEAPGFHEDIQKRPFVGRGGQLLNQLLAEINWRREEAYITNIVKRRPPENRDPLPEEIAAYRPYLTRQIEIINATIIVTLGRFSMNYFLPEAKISRDHGKVFHIDGRLVYPIYHPAAALRNPDMMADFKKDMKKLPSLVKKKDVLLKRAQVGNISKSS